MIEVGVNYSKRRVSINVVNPLKWGSHPSLCRSHFLVVLGQRKGKKTCFGIGSKLNI